MVAHSCGSTQDRDPHPSAVADDIHTRKDRDITFTQSAAEIPETTLMTQHAGSVERFRVFQPAEFSTSASRTHDHSQHVKRRTPSDLTHSSPDLAVYCPPQSRDSRRTGPLGGHTHTVHPDPQFLDWRRKKGDSSLSTTAESFGTESAISQKLFFSGEGSPPSSPVSASPAQRGAMEKGRCVAERGASQPAAIHERSSTSCSAVHSTSTASAKCDRDSQADQALTINRRHQRVRGSLQPRIARLTAAAIFLAVLVLLPLQATALSCTSTADCPTSSTCNSTSLVCQCLTGYSASYVSGNLSSCSDVDECTLCTDNCDPWNADCTNTDGSFECECLDGYEGDGITCVDVCTTGTNDCHPNATCLMLVDAGSFYCDCNEGFYGDGVLFGGNESAAFAEDPLEPKGCWDVLECDDPDLNNCNSNATCTETVGSFTCACNTGFVGDGVSSCANIFECDLGIDNCDLNATCIETVGSFECQCNAGFGGNGTNCTDLDECSLGTHNCAVDALGRPAAQCVNTTGSFTCTCLDGFDGDGVTCTNKLECDNTDGPNGTNVRLCHTKATCSDTEGSFLCTCNDGYIGNGTFCEDENECQRPNATVCAQNATCFNTIGSFYCECSLGYAGLPDSCAPCAPGEYKDTTGSAACSLCPERTYNPIAAATNASFCRECSDFSYAPPGSDWPGACVCFAGYALNFATGACQACAAGSYKPERGPQPCDLCAAGYYSTAIASSTILNCTLCPTNTFSFPPGRGRLDECICVPGYTGPDGQACAGCPAGTYKEVNGSAACTLCEEHTFSTRIASDNRSSCVECTPNAISPSGSSEIGNCSCVPGYGTSTDFGVSRELCLPCPRATWKNTTGSVPCSPCPADSDSELASVLKTNCSCNQGFVGEDGGQCSICPEDTYKNTSGPGTCRPCPENQVAPAGTEVVYECACPPGFSGENGVSCTACAHGTYKPFVGTDDCYPCVENSDSASGSRLPLDCVCNIGYVGKGDTACTDVDECLEGLHTCDPRRAFCQNTDGSFACVCQTNFEGNGTVCLPESVGIRFFVGVPVISGVFNLTVYVGAIADFADVDQEVVDTFHDYASRRRLLVQESILGVYGNDTVIQNVTFEIRLKLQNALLMIETLNTTTFNAYLSSRNITLVDFVSQPFIIAQCGNGIIEMWEECDDLNSVGGDGCSSLCVEEIGWNCTQRTNCSQVPDSFNVDFPVTCCENLDECWRGSHTCDQFATCVDSPGSFVCMCYPGFIGDGTECEDDPADYTDLQRDTYFNATASPIYREAADGFGYAMATHREILLVTSLEAGRFWVYERDGESSWPDAPTVILTTTDTDTIGVAADVSSLVLPGPGQNRRFHAVVGTNRGKVYIYQKTEPSAWTLQPALVLERDEDFFGTAVAVAGDTLVVGAWGENVAFIYRLGPDGSWPTTPSVVLDQNTGDTYFGHALAMVEGRIVVGALHVDKAFIFEQRADGTWPRTATFQIDADCGKTMVGASLSMSTSHIFIGAAYLQRVYIFSRLDDAANWTRSAVKEISIQEGRFGYCVSNTDLYAVVGGFRANEAFLFQARRNGTWSENPVQRIAEGANDARSLGFTCAVTNHDVILSSYQDRSVFVHSSGCAQSYYGWSIDNCVACPKNQTSPAMSKTFDSCSCMPGYYQPSGQTNCLGCPRGSYCPGGGPIIDCGGAQFTSRPFSTSSQDCIFSEFTMTNISQSTVSQGASNTITVTLATNVFLNPGDGVVFTISGLTCNGTACALPGSAIALVYDALAPAEADLFTPSYLPNGALTLRLAKEFPPRTASVFSFTLINPSIGQYSPAISIESSGFIIPRIAMAKAGGSLAPLSVAGFVAAEIQQSTPSQLASNILTGAVTMYASLLPGDVVEVSGLVGTNVQTTTRPITGNAVFDPTAEWNGASGVLRLRLVQETTADVRYSFSFPVTNGAQGQAAPPALVLAESGLTGARSAAVLMTTPSDLTAALIIASFTSAILSQTSFVPMGTNTLTVSFQTNVPLPVSKMNSNQVAVRSIVTISGLAGAVPASPLNGTNMTREGDAVVAIDALLANTALSFGSIAVWQEDDKALTVAVNSATLAGATYSFSFDVKNPAFGQNSPLIYIESSGMEISKTLITPADGPAAPLLISGFRTKTISQTSICPGSVNTLLVTLNVFVGIPFKPISSNGPSCAECGKNATITISGLTGSNSSEILSLTHMQAQLDDANNTVTWSESPASVFLESWSRDSGELKLRLATDTYLPPNVNFALNISLRNSLVGQDSPAIAIMGSESATISRIAMDQGFGDAAPFRISGFRHTLIEQESTSVLANNTITFGFSLFTTLPGDSTITIVGLEGSQTPDGDINLIQDGSNFLPSAQWVQSSGQLVLSVANNSLIGWFGANQAEQDSLPEGAATNPLVGRRYEFSFVLTNPLEGQGSPAISASASHDSFCASAGDLSSGKIAISETTVTKGPGNTAPLIVADLSFKAMRQSNASAGVRNTVTLDIIPRASLAVGSLITIEGLECVRCGSTCVAKPAPPFCCQLTIDSVRQNGTATFLRSRDQPQSSGFLFEDTADITSSYPIDTVTIQLNAPLVLDERYEINFITQSNDCGQLASSEILISATSPPGVDRAEVVTIAPSPVDLGVGQQQPLLINFFPDLRVSQSTSAASATNMFTVRWSTQAPSSPGSGVLVSGFTGAQTPSGPLVLSGADAGQFSSAVWSFEDEHVILFWGENGSIAEQVYEVSFELVNPDEAQEMSETSIQILDQGALTTLERTDVGVDSCASYPLFVATFSIKDIGQSTAMPGALNTLSVTLASTVEINPEGCPPLLLTISGLVQTDTPDATSLPFSAPYSSLAFCDDVGEFATFVSWVQETGTLVVQLTKLFQPNEPQVFTLQVTNPLFAQRAVTPTISMQGISIAESNMNIAEGATAPLIVKPNITEAFIWQTTPSANTLNTIQVTLSTRYGIAFDPSIFVTISGLTGSLTENLTLPISVSSTAAASTSVNGSQVWPDLAAWSQSSGTLVFSSLSDFFLSAGEQLTLAFNLTNPANYFEPPTVSLMVEALETGWVIMDKAQGNHEPLRVAAFLEGCISQTSVSQNALNKLTVTFRLSVSLEPGTLVQVSGLVDTQTFASSLPVSHLFSQDGLNTSGLNCSSVPNSNSPGFTAGNDTFAVGGEWNRNSGTLLVPVESSANDVRVFVLIFTVKNPTVAGPAVEVFISGTGFLTMVPFQLQPGPGNAAPLLIAGFSLLEISQSDPAVSRRNEITVSLRANVIIVAGSVLTVAGIVETRTLSGTVAVRSEPEVFNDVATWDQTTGTVIVAVTDSSAADTDVQFSFDVLNPRVGQESPKINISATGTNITLVPMTKGPGNRAAMLIADILQKDVSQQTPSQAAQNDVRFQLRFNFDIIGSLGYVIRISGLVGWDTAFEPFPVGRDASLMGDVDVQDAAAGTLEIPILGNVSARSDLDFSLRFRNPTEERSPPTVFVRVSGYISTAVIEMDNGEGISAPFLVTNFKEKFIQQSTPSASALNTMTVRMALNVPLPALSNITISSLEGAVSDEQIELRLVETVGHVFPTDLDGNSGPCIIDANLTSVTTNATANQTSCTAAPDMFSRFATWNASANSSVVFQVMTALQPFAVYVVQFEVTNPALGQESPPVQISSDGFVALPHAMDKGAENEAPLLVADFMVRHMAQTSPSNGLDNTLIVQLQPRLNLTNETLITLTGIDGVTTPNVDLPIVTTAPFSTTGRWSSDLGGSFLFSVQNPGLNAKETYEIRFTITNAVFGQPSPEIFIESSGIVTTRALVSKATGNEAPMLLAGFISTRVAQSSPSMNGVNTITVTLSTLHTFNRGNTITIDGLQGTVTPDDPALPISAFIRRPQSIRPLSAAEFGQVGRWTQSSGRLILTIFRDSVPNVDYWISFQVQNDNIGQDSKTVRISSDGVNTPDGPGIRIERQALVSALGNAAPMLIADVLQGHIGQSEPSAFSENTITVTLNTRASLIPGTTVIVSGLTGSTTPTTEAIELSGSGVHVFGSVGEWNITGQLTLTVVNSSVPRADYQVAVVLRNQGEGQRSPPTFVESLGAVVIERTPLTPDTGNKEPMKIPFFIAEMVEGQAIAQTIPHANADNTITVTMGIQEIIIPTGTEISITGLHGSATPTGVLPLTGSLGSSLALLTDTVNGESVTGRVRWNQTRGEAVMITAQEIAPLPEGYVVSFSLRNRAEGQEPPLLFLEMSGELTVARQLVTVQSGNRAPLRIAGFLSTYVNQSTSTPGDSNKITVRFMTNIDYQVVEAGDFLPPNPTRLYREVKTQSIYITNLINSPMSDRSDVQVVSSPPGVISPVGIWTQATGTMELVVSPLSTLTAYTEYTVSFHVTNPLDGMLAPPVEAYAAGRVNHVGGGLINVEFKQTISPTLMVQEPGNFGPFIVAGFQIRDIAQSTPSAFAENVFTVTLASYVACTVDDACAITIHGLVGSATPDNPALPLTASLQQADGTLTASNIFGNSGVWNQANGSLAFELLEPNERLLPYVLQFTLENSGDPQDGVAALISSTGKEVPEIPMFGAPGNRAPMLIAGFLWKDIGQSNPSVGARNTISITISTRSSLLAGTEVTVSGLIGSVEGNASAASSLAESINFDGNTTFELVSWELERGVLVVRVANDTEARIPYNISFDVFNPIFGQDSPAISIEASDPIRILPVPMDAGSGNNAPLLIADLVIKQIGQSTVNAMALRNVITVTVAPRASLPPGNRIVITGLEGSSNPGRVGSWGNFSAPPDDDCPDRPPLNTICRMPACLALMCTYLQLEDATATWVLTSTMEADELYVIQFFITNPAARQESPSISIQALGSVQSTRQEMGKGSGNQAPLLVAGFTTAYIEQDSFYASTNNTFSISIATNAILWRGSEIQISGLLGMRPLNNRTRVSVVSSGDSMGVFSTEGEWDGVLGQLRVGLTADVEARQNYSFSFALTNPPVGQFSQDVSILVDNRTVVSEVAMSKGPIWTAPMLFLFEFSTAFASQNTTKPGEMNTLFFSLISREHLLGSTGIEVIVSGLTGTETEGTPGPCGDSCISVVSGCTSGPFRRSAAWNRTTGTLRMLLVRDLVASEPVGFSIDVQNGRTGQVSPEVSIIATGVPMEPRSVSVPDNNRAPLLIAGFRSATIAQDSPYATTLNQLTVSFSSLVSLTAAAGTKLTISGLVGFETRGTQQLDLCGSANSTLENSTRGFNEPILYGHQGFCVIETDPNATLSQQLYGEGYDGFEYTATTAPFNPVSSCQYFSNFVSRTAEWNQNAGELVFSIVRDTVPDETYTFSFTLLNGVAARGGLPNITIESRGVFLPQHDVISAPGVAAPGLVAGWQQRSIGQLTHVAGASNVISITIAADAALEQDRINITLYFVDVDAADIEIISAASGEVGYFNLEPTPEFGSRATWVPQEAYILFQLVGGMEMERQYVIDILIDNPITGRDGFANFGIVASHFGRILLPFAPIDVAPRNQVPFLVANFVNMDIRQTTFAAGGYNTMHLSLVSRSTLDGYFLTKITVSGLTGSATQGYNDVLPLSRNSHPTLGGYGRWFQAEGILVLTLFDEDIPADELIYAQFDLLNGPDFQAARNVSVQAEYLDWLEGYVPLGAVQRIETNHGYYDPLLILGFQTAYIEQTSSSANDINPILVNISTGVGMPPSQFHITISGLFGTATDEPTLPVAVGVLPQTDGAVINSESVSGLCGAVSGTPAPPSTQDVLTNTGCADLDSIINGITATQADTSPGSSGEHCIEGELVNARWNQTAGTLEVDVTERWSASQSYTIYFVLVNGVIAQPAQDIQVSASVNGTDIAAVSPQTGINNSAPLLIIGWAMREVAQSTFNSGVENSITVSLSFSGQILPRTIIRLSGFENAQDAPGCKQVEFPNHALPGEAARVFTDVASWTSSGEILIGVKERSVVGTDFVLLFRLTNPVLGQYPSGVEVKTEGRLQLAAIEMTSSDISAALSVAGFDAASIEQSTAAAGSNNNTLSVSFSLFVPLLAALPSRITIQGLSGAVAGSGAIPLRSTTSDFHTSFGNEGIWDAANGALVLTVVRDAVAQHVYSFSFQIQNPPSGQASPAISIRSTGGVDSTSYPMGTGDGNAAVLLVNEFLVKNVGQSTVSQSAVNTLVVTLSTRASLLAGSVVTISGLVGSDTRDNSSLPISVNVAANQGALSHFSSVADWTQATGAMKIRVNEDTIPDSQYVFEVHMQNPANAQGPVGAVSISASGVTISASSMVVAGGNDAPFLVVGFNYARLHQAAELATAYANDALGGLPAVDNTLMFEFETSAVLVTDTELVLTGLVGSGTPSTNSLAISCAPDHLSNTAQWSQSDGSLTMTVSADTSANTRYQCSFTLVHPSTMQEHPSVTLSAQGETVISPLAVLPEQGNTSALALTSVWCSPYPRPSNATVVPGDRVLSAGAVAVSCDQGFELSPANNTAVCLPDGTWSLLIDCAAVPVTTTPMPTTTPSTTNVTRR